MLFQYKDLYYYITGLNIVIINFLIDPGIVIKIFIFSMMEFINSSNFIMLISYSKSILIRVFKSIIKFNNFLIEKKTSALSILFYFFGRG
jgi:hypothetical protein